MKDYIPKLVPINIFTIIVFFVFWFGVNAGENNLLSESPNDDVLAGIVNPFDSTCYDWRGNIIPCNFKRQYSELLLDKPIPAPRFIDNQDGTVTDSLTKLIWLKNTNCFGMVNWEGAMLAVKSLKDGDCGPDPALILSDGSSAGDWRLPTMSELCILIDFSAGEILPYQEAICFRPFHQVTIGRRQRLIIIPEWLGLCTSNPVPLVTMI
jgi:hypothetical protein